MAIERARTRHVLPRGCVVKHVLLTIGVSAACDILLIGLGDRRGRQPLRRQPGPDGGGALWWCGLPRLVRRACAALGAAWRAHDGTHRTPADVARPGAARGRRLQPAQSARLPGYGGAARLDWQPAGRGPAPLFAAGAITASIVWFLLLGYGARLLAPLFAKPLAWRVLDALVALVLWAIAASLLLA